MIISDEITAEQLQELAKDTKLTFKPKTDINVVNIKPFQESDTIKKIGGVYISKIEAMKDNQLENPANFKYFKYGLPIPNMDPEFKS